MKRVFWLLLILLIPTLFVLAQGFDDQGNPNDPATNPRANACYEGGTLANQCDTEWEWTCGWYLIRLEQGTIGEGAFPAACSALLSSPPEVWIPTPISYPTAGCIAVRPSHYADFGGNSYLPAGQDIFFNSDCTNQIATTLVDFVYSPWGSGIAQDLCQLRFGRDLLSGPAGDNVYTCEDPPIP